MADAYHKDVFMPARLRDALAGRRLLLRSSRHAAKAALDDNLFLPGFVTITPENLVEVYVDGEITKVLLRDSFRPGADLCIVVAIATGVIITCWGNHPNDRHRTLDRSRYRKS
jgi:hypothetical protein